MLVKASIAQSNHLLFYTIDEEKKVVTVLRVLQDGMNREYIIQSWIKRTSQLKDNPKNITKTPKNITKISLLFLLY